MLGTDRHQRIAVKQCSSPWISSQYNFAIPAGEHALLYNTASGAVLRLGGKDAYRLAKWLSSKPVQVSADQIPSPTFNDLIEARIIVPEGTDELALVRDAYQRARDTTPAVVTITTTMDCNLGCYYCYEQRTGDALRAHDADRIVDLVIERLKTNGRRSLHVDWYGGEPLLNVGFLEVASRALQKSCNDLGIAYTASVVSNGTCWPADVARFIEEHRIRQVQISFDGMKPNHDRRRRYRDAYRKGDEQSSFDLAAQLVDKLLDRVRVDVRLNVDWGNAEDVEPFIALARERGWFLKPFPVVIQPARLASFSARSAFMRNHELSIVEYDAVRRRVREAVQGDAIVEECEAPDGFPLPRSSVCAALARDSVVVGADQQLYRCGLQVGERHRAVGSLNSRSDLLPIIQPASDDAFWDEFDPTRQPNCSRCSFLPICWGGCPKKHLEGDTTALDEQGEYWRRNLPRLVANRFSVSVDPDFMLTISDQFRSTERPT